METPGMIKTRLLLRKAEIEARFGQHQNYPASHLDDAVERSEQPGMRHSIYSLEQEALAELVKINRALQRLEQGEYTKCSNCSLPISERRLKAFPATDLCYNCATKSYFTI